MYIFSSSHFLTPSVSYYLVNPLIISTFPILHIIAYSAIHSYYFFLLNPFLCNHWKVGVFKKQKVGFKNSTLVFPSTRHVRSHHTKFQPSRPTRTPSTGYPYFQQRMSKENTFKFTEWSNLSPCAKIKKIKGTFYFLQHLKFEKTKCPQFFQLLLRG